MHAEERSVELSFLQANILMWPLPDRREGKIISFAIFFLLAQKLQSWKTWKAGVLHCSFRRKFMHSLFMRQIRPGTQKFLNRRWRFLWIEYRTSDIMSDKQSEDRSKGTGEGRIDSSRYFYCHALCIVFREDSAEGSSWWLGSTNKVCRRLQYITSRYIHIYHRSQVDQ